ncbi:unnamed protein product [Paramecium pentaurelia]|uniref:Uncharacterized protein n=1 Tax=Paramecium pentaurelia TaxID=43138 RepID=A0A8S1UYI4_9CILI|nr:unnamed protein product [Paramecium pentaurelia]
MFQQFHEQKNLIDYYFNFKRDIHFSLRFEKLCIDLQLNQKKSNRNKYQNAIIFSIKAKVCFVKQTQLYRKQIHFSPTSIRRSGKERKSILTMSKNVVCFITMNRPTFKNYIAEKVSKIIDVWIILKRKMCLIFHYIWIIILKLLKSQ